MALIGKPVNRIDGKLKVTGVAQYAGEFNQPNMAYAVPVRSAVAKGTVINIDASMAKQSGGVIAILTHQNAPKLKDLQPAAMQSSGASLSEMLVPLQNNKVEYFGQFVGLVIAETYEQARAAAEMIKISYAKEKPVVDLRAQLHAAKKPEKTAQGEPAQLNMGKAAAPLAASAQKIEATYSTSVENHHPMEPHASIAMWEGMDQLTVYHSTQGVLGTRASLAYLFELKPENVRILSPFLGGGFGCKGGVWSQLVLAVMSAKAISRPVKLVITRQMMATTTGRRAPTLQNLNLGTDASGRLTAMRHNVNTYNNLTNFFEPSGAPTKILYAAPVREITYAVTKLTLGAPTYMRAPGDASGSFALESAIDEMAYKLKMDPLEFRRLNHTSTDIENKLPFSSENLLECYRIGAESFGWDQRKTQPRQLRQGKNRIGYGMATATYHASRSITAVRIRMNSENKVHLMCATQDIGTGTYTIMAQMAADTLGLPIDNITVEIGDSNLPPAPLSAGSQTTASVMPAVIAAAEQLRKEIAQLAMADSKSELSGKSLDAIGYADGTLYVKDSPSRSESYRNILRRANKDSIETCVSTKPVMDGHLGPKAPPCMPQELPPDVNIDGEKYTFQSFGAQFAEVWVDEDLGTIRIKRFTSVHDVGSIMNEKTARSQVMGAVIFAIGQALMEETIFDNRYGNPVMRTLADYHVPVQLDIPDIDVHFINKPDPHISPIGARGLGEIGGVGVAAAIANAIFNATGKRVRGLPLTLDKLL